MVRRVEERRRVASAASVDVEGKGRRQGIVSVSVSVSGSVSVLWRFVWRDEGEWSWRVLYVLENGGIACCCCCRWMTGRRGRRKGKRSIFIFFFVLTGVLDGGMLHDVQNPSSLLSKRVKTRPLDVHWSS